MIFSAGQIKELHGAESLLQKLPVAHLLKHFPTFYRTRKFTTVFTRALSEMNPVYSHFSKIHLDIALSLPPRPSQWALFFWILERTTSKVILNSPYNKILIR
jgi:hypothetical protein